MRSKYGNNKETKQILYGIARKLEVQGYYGMRFCINKVKDFFETQAISFAGTSVTYFWTFCTIYHFL